MTPSETAPAKHRELGLTDHEYDLIVEKLGREPNGVELAIFSLMWSEHCAYKHSKRLLRTLPVEGGRVVMGPGENAGAVSLGGGPVLGICNGFQVLCEAGLLPGALLPNTSLRFTCRQVDLDVVNASTRWTSACAVGDVLSIPAKHQTGRYWAPDPVLDELEANDQVVLRYAPGDNFNGSARDIAGVCNAAGNVLGLMPHPEHAVDPLTGSDDGLKLFRSAALVAA